MYGSVTLSMNAFRSFRVCGSGDYGGRVSTVVPVAIPEYAAQGSAFGKPRQTTTKPQTSET